jgi:signal transduction histidine kinase
VFDFDGNELVTDVRLNELSEEKIYNLCPDAQNRMWFSGNSGIGCLLPNNGPIIRLGMHNNLQSLEFNQNAAAQSSNGWIYFGGIQGLNGIQPENIVFERYNPGVRLISLEVADSVLTKGIPANKLQLELDWRNAHVSGQIASLVNENQELTTYSFYMDGYQSDWGPRSYSRTFSYRDLPPGNYTLKVVSFDAYQNQSNIIELLQLHIPQPYYKRTWFVLFLLSILLVMVVLVVKRVQYMRFRQKLQDLQQLNAIDKERLRISQDMHDEIGASLTRISILSEQVKNKRSNQEEALKIVNQISAIAGKVVDDMGEIIWAMNPKNDSAEGFASYLRQYAANYLEQTGIEAIFEIQEDIPEIKLGSELRRNLFLVVKEALHNVVKHSKANQVLISLKLQNHGLNLSIKDNGIGFEPNASTTWGNGLKNMPLRVNNAGGSIQINSAYGKGVEIIIRINSLK